MTESANFSARDVLDLVQDLLEPNPFLYWMDLLLTISIAYTAFAGYLLAEPLSGLQIGCFFMAGFAFYRAAVFTHEIQHFRTGTMRSFRVVWNLVCGIPMMIPSFLYDDHMAHHVNHSYGTSDDSEYYPLGAGSARHVILFILGSFLLPVLGPIRFLIVGPIRWLVPRLRSLIWSRASSLSVMNPRYRRPPATPDEAREALGQEISCFLVGWSLVILIALTPSPWLIVGKTYLLFLFWNTVNHLRTLGAHRYRNVSGTMTYREQLLDTNTYPPIPFLTALWAPLGMHYHALHHLVPPMPYHNLHIAHRRLMRLLSADSPYRATMQPHLLAAIGSMLQARSASRSQSDEPLA